MCLCMCVCVLIVAAVVSLAVGILEDPSKGWLDVCVYVCCICFMCCMCCMLYAVCVLTPPFYAVFVY
jgi:hypothetical protein